MLTAFIQEKGKPFETAPSRARMLGALKNPDCLLWVDLENPDEFEADSLVEIFNFHPLAVEDCVSDLTSPKVDDYDDYLFLVMNALRHNDQGDLATAELDIFLGKNYVVTCHETPVRSVEQVRLMVKKKNNFYMGGHAALLAHALLDRLVDNYLPVLDRYDEKIDELEERALKNENEDYLAPLLQIKHDLSLLRRAVGPQRDTIYYLTRNATDLIPPEHMIYFRDIYDHLFRIYGMTEGFHEKLGLLMQVYFSISSNKLNNIMKRMTVMATLTMPALIIASIYGMNFASMPELSHPYGYYGALALMAVTALCMLIWMKWKKWI